MWKLAVLKILLGVRFEGGPRAFRLSIMQPRNQRYLHLKLNRFLKIFFYCQFIRKIRYSFSIIKKYLLNNNFKETAKSKAFFLLFGTPFSDIYANFKWNPNISVNLAAFYFGFKVIENFQIVFNYFFNIFMDFGRWKIYVLLLNLWILLQNDSVPSQTVIRRWGNSFIYRTKSSWPNSSTALQCTG